jgi:hypothetical protein
VRLRGGRQRRWNFNDVGYGRWKQGKGGNWVRPLSEGKWGRRRGGSTVPKVDDTTKSGMVPRRLKAAADIWRSKMTK